MHRLQIPISRFRSVAGALQWERGKVARWTAPSHFPVSSHFTHESVPAARGVRIMEAVTSICRLIILSSCALYEHIGDVERSRGDTAPARQAYEKALAYRTGPADRKRLRSKLK